ncbi:hypothetical protein Vadar_008031 [Vaccinium darrowii]|uniref:Uncharacterized protein n=1 Tax=Vaccinium darrowii TaxID=229202 RepID=A0ACB7YU43_9ERIC|nr:hypothetical protein Vadar_008031 [Vaccinium darrowii]
MVENVRRPSREETLGKLYAALRLQSLEWPRDKKPQAFKLNWPVIVYDVVMLVITNFIAVFNEVVYVVLTNVKAIKVMNMPFTKEQARRRERELSNPNEAELEQPPQKWCQHNHGYNLFVKDVSSGLMLGLGKKTYASYVTRGVLMFRAKQWYQDEVPNLKKIYAEKAMEERAELPPLPEKLKSKTTKSVQSLIRTRCSPKQLVELNAKLSESKRDALIKRNPFQTLLGLSCPYLHREFMMELVERFNPKNRTLEFRNGLRCRVTEEDFARVLGFPIGHIDVPTECDDIHRDKVEEDFRNLENAYKAINLNHLKAMIENNNVNDDVFQRAYMLFTLGCLLCPTTKDVVGSRLFPAVYDDDNMDTMKAYKWLAFMLDWLANEIQNYKDRESKQRPCQGKGVGGSLFILMGFIKAYVDLVYNFERDAKNLRDLDAEWSTREEVMNRALVRGTTSSPKEDGPSDFNLTPKEAVVDERPVCYKISCISHNTGYFTCTYYLHTVQHDNGISVIGKTTADVILLWRFWRL